VPVLFSAAHLLLPAQLLRCVAEALRRAPARRRGPVHNAGALLGAVVAPVTERFSPPPAPPRTKWTRRVPHPVLIGHAASLRFSGLGLCRYHRAGGTLVSASLDAWDLLRRTGLEAAVNEDLLFGARVCVCLLVASSASVVGNTLASAVGFPLIAARQVGMMCYIAAFLNGNWGMEVWCLRPVAVPPPHLLQHPHPSPRQVAETWAAALFLEFAEEPEVSPCPPSPHLTCMGSWSSSLNVCFSLGGLHDQSTARQRGRSPGRPGGCGAGPWLAARVAVGGPRS